MSEIEWKPIEIGAWQSWKCLTLFLPRHAPFAAFLDLDPAATARVRAAGLAAALGAILHGAARRGTDPDPPVLRVGKHVPAETLALLGVGSYAASVAALPLRRALGDTAFKTLAAGALAYVAAAIVHVAAGYGHVAAHGLSLVGAALYALVVLKSLVWHFLPTATPATAGDPP